MTSQLWTRLFVVCVVTCSVLYFTVFRSEMTSHVRRSLLSSDFYLQRTTTSSNPKTFQPVDVVTRELQATTLKNLHLPEAKKSLERLLSLIYRRYEFDTKRGSNFFRTANNLDKRTWDILKYKFATKMLHHDSSFLMIFGGSSVTAGHDNFYNQSYPYIFKARMQEVFANLNMNLVVHNIALGANGCVPYIACYESMGGIGPDFINWEQSYNCGRDGAVFEAAARVAGYSYNAPSVVYYSASGAWSPRGCPASPDPVPYCAENWTPAIAKLPEWEVTMEKVAEERDALFKFNTAKPSSNRFSGGVAGHYQGIGFHGFNVWEPNRECVFVNPKNNKTENCNGIDAVEGCSMKFMSNEAGDYGSLDGRGANWHPTRAFHMLRGEAIVWIYSLILYEVVNMVEQDSLTKTKKEMLEDYEAKLNAFKVPLPAPRYCGNLHCDKKPVCFTDFRPHYSQNLTLSELVVGETKWLYDPAELNAWSTTYGYLDAKAIFSSHKAEENGQIHFKVKVARPNENVWICGQIKESLLHARFYLDANAGATAEKGKYAPSSTRVEWTKKKYINNECKELYELPEGHHVISVENGGDKNIEISHLLTWE